MYRCDRSPFEPRPNLLRALLCRIFSKAMREIAICEWTNAPSVVKVCRNAAFSSGAQESYWDCSGAPVLIILARRTLLAVSYAKKVEITCTCSSDCSEFSVCRMHYRVSSLRCSGTVITDNVPRLSARGPQITCSSWTPNLHLKHFKQELWKLVKIWRSYRRKRVARFFGKQRVPKRINTDQGLTKRTRSCQWRATCHGIQCSHPAVADSEEPRCHPWPPTYIRRTRC